MGKHTPGERTSQRIEQAVEKTVTRTLREERRFAIRLAFWGAILGIFGAELLGGAGHAAILFVERPCVTAEGYHTGLRSYLPPDAQPRGSVDLGSTDLPNGSLYAYQITVRNTGRGALLDATLRLNLPGVPLVTYGTRPEADVAVEIPTMTLLDFATARVRDFRFDPRILLHPSIVPSNYILIDNATHEPLGATAPIPLWQPPVPGTIIVGASGTNTATYRLATLPAHSDWTTQTIYFGNRTSPAGLAVLTAAAPTYLGDAHTERANLSRFDLTSDGSDPLTNMCGWPVFPT